MMPRQINSKSTEKLNKQFKLFTDVVLFNFQDFGTSLVVPKEWRKLCCRRNNNRKHTFIETCLPESVFQQKPGQINI